MKTLATIFFLAMLVGCSNNPVAPPECPVAFSRHISFKFPPIKDTARVYDPAQLPHGETK